MRTDKTMLGPTRLSTRVFLLWLCCGLLTCAHSQTAQIPRVEGESLTGHKVVLPDDAAGNVAVLVFGFSKASKSQTSEWARKLSADLGNHTGFAIYQLPVLEDVPRLIRGMVISGMKKSIPTSAQDHFVPILQGEAELKKVVDYKEPDDAYVVLLDRQGKIVQQGHGSPSDPLYSQLRTRIESMLNQK